MKMSFNTPMCISDMHCHMKTREIEKEAELQYISYHI